MLVISDECSIRKTIVKSIEDINKQTGVLEIKNADNSFYNTDTEDAYLAHVAEADDVEYTTKSSLEKAIGHTKKQMDYAAKNLDFIEAARLRDKMLAMKKELEAF